MAAKKRGPKVVTPEHKAAMAAGRQNAAAVRAYLDALEEQSPKRRGRQISPEELQKRLDAANEVLPSLSGIKWVEKRQEILDLETRLAEDVAEPEDISELEEAFVAAAKPWAESKGITKKVLREAGVPAAVLKRAFS